MCHLFELVLDVALNLQDPVVVLRVINLRRDLAGLGVHARLQKALGVVQLVVGHVRKELRQLVVHLRSSLVVLDIEVAIAEQTQRCSVSRCELKLILQNRDRLIAGLAIKKRDQ
jgi:hypothetical protein